MKSLLFYFFRALSKLYFLESIWIFENENTNKMACSKDNQFFLKLFYEYQSEANSVFFTNFIKKNIVAYFLLYKKQLPTSG
jgi:hypothetical protein